MGLCVGGAEASGVYVGPTPAVAVYLGATRVWEAGGGGRSSLSEYSLAELSAISADLTANGEASGHYEEFSGYVGQEYDFGAWDEGSAAAARYPEGHVASHCHAVLVGLLHDDLSDGTGRAGLSFISGNTILENSYPMGGAWGSSNLRGLLNESQDALSPHACLPAALKAAVREVTKVTNDSETSDAFWAPSIAELSGWTEYGSSGRRYAAFSAATNERASSYGSYYLNKVTGMPQWVRFVNVRGSATAAASTQVWLRNRRETAYYRAAGTEDSGSTTTLKPSIVSTSSDATHRVAYGFCI